MFVELTRGMSVDPTEVAMVVGRRDGRTNVYIRAAGPARNRWLLVDRPVAEVTRQLQAARKSLHTQVGPSG